MRDRGAVFVYEDVRIRKRNKLPHWHARCGLYFLTYRLGDALPVQHQQRIENAVSYERKRLFCEGVRGRELEEAVARFAFKRTQPVLDRSYGACVLGRDVCASVVADVWQIGAGKVHDPISWTVMPNHAHIVTRLLGNADVSDVVKAWKSTSTREINRLLLRRGPLWQDDYFDVLIRDERQLRSTVQYVLDNPAKAGLVDWKWVEADPAALHRTIDGR